MNTKPKSKTEVFQAIVSVADHGDGCMCTQCQIDFKLIDENPEILNDIMLLCKKLKP